MAEAVFKALSTYVASRRKEAAVHLSHCAECTAEAQHCIDLAERRVVSNAIRALTLKSELQEAHNEVSWLFMSGF